MGGVLPAPFLRRLGLFVPALDRAVDAGGNDGEHRVVQEILADQVGVLGEIAAQHRHLGDDVARQPAAEGLLHLGAELQEPRQRSLVADIAEPHARQRRAGHADQARLEHRVPAHPVLLEMELPVDVVLLQHGAVVLAQLAGPVVAPVLQQVVDVAVFLQGAIAGGVAVAGELLEPVELVPRPEHELVLVVLHRLDHREQRVPAHQQQLVARGKGDDVFHRFRTQPCAFVAARFLIFSLTRWPKPLVSNV
ncbi:MAG: hypothetical protein WDN72_03500 [Alphaproteobacteria bacterium]